MLVKVLFGVADTKELAHSLDLCPGHKGRILMDSLVSNMREYQTHRHESKTQLCKSSLDIGILTFAIFAIKG